MRRRNSDMNSHYRVSAKPDTEFTSNLSPFDRVRGFCNRFPNVHQARHYLPPLQTSTKCGHSPHFEAEDYDNIHGTHFHTCAAPKQDGSTLRSRTRPNKTANSINSTSSSSSSEYQESQPNYRRFYHVPEPNYRTSLLVDPTILYFYERDPRRRLEEHPECPSPDYSPPLSGSSAKSRQVRFLLPNVPISAGHVVSFSVRSGVGSEPLRPTENRFLNPQGLKDSRLLKEAHTLNQSASSSNVSSVLDPRRTISPQLSLQDERILDGQSSARQSRSVPASSKKIRPPPLPPAPPSKNRLSRHTHSGISIHEPDESQCCNLY